MDMILAQQNMPVMYYPTMQQTLVQISSPLDTLALFALFDKVTTLAPYGKHTLNVKIQLEDIFIQYLNVWQQK